MVRRRHSSVRPDHPLRRFLPHARCRDKAHPSYRDNHDAVLDAFRRFAHLRICA